MEAHEGLGVDSDIDWWGLTQCVSGEGAYSVRAVPCAAIDHTYPILG